MNKEDDQRDDRRFQQRRGAVDYSVFDIVDKARKRINLANNLRLRLIELDGNGDAARDANSLNGVRKAIREILEEFIAVGLDDGVRINRSLSRLAITERGERSNSP